MYIILHVHVCTCMYMCVIVLIDFCCAGVHKATNDTKRDCRDII